MSLIEPQDEDQKEHMLTEIEILKRSLLALDKSPTGGGKTFHQGYVVQRNPPARALVVCPPKAVVVWTNMLKTHAISNVGVYTYDSMRPIATRPNTLLVSTTEFIEEKVGNTIKNRPASAVGSDWFIQQMKAGPLFLIFDEYHRAKNVDTANTLLVRSLISTLRDYNDGKFNATGDNRVNSVRVIMCSATPYDKREHALTFLHTVGIIRTPGLYEVNDQGSIANTAGYDQLIAYCDAKVNDPFFSKRISPVNIEWYKAFKADPFNNPKNNPSINQADVAANLSLKIIEPAISSRTRIKGLTNGRNAFYAVSAEDQEKITEAVQNLASASGYRGEGKKAGRNQGFGAIQTALMGVERSKLPIFRRLLKQTLEEYPNYKVVITLSFVDSVNDLYNYAKSLGINALMLTGDVKPENREAIRLKFQEPNLDYRVMLMSIQTGGESISLHDLDGRFPRVMYISPVFSAIQMLQAAGRIDRRGVKSPAYVRFVYAIVPAPEERILHTVGPKYELLEEHRVSSGEVKEDITENILPHDYPAFVEGVGEVDTIGDALTIIYKHFGKELPRAGSERPPSPRRASTRKSAR